MQTGWLRLAFAFHVAAGIAAAHAATIDVVPGFQTLQNAIDAASPGDTLRLQAGGGYEGDVDVTKPLTIRGVGTPPPLIANTCTPLTSLKISADGVRVRNVQVYGGSSSTIGVEQRERVTLTDVSLESHCGFDAYGINVVQSARVTLKRVHVFGGYLEAGIRIGGIAERGRVKVTVSTSEYGTRGIVVEASGERSVTVRKNTVNNNGAAGIFLQDADGIQVIANTVTDNGAAGIELDADSSGNLIKRNTIAGSTLDVVDDGTGNCWTGNTFTTGSVGPCP